jgi:hypothetical protein
MSGAKPTIYYIVFVIVSPELTAMAGEFPEIKKKSRPVVVFPKNWD